MKLLTPAAFILLIARASADAIHIANANLWYSEFLYYVNDADSNNGQKPPSSDICTFSGNLVFEGVTRSCTFSTGVTFESHIVSNGASLQVGAYAGWGTNGFNTYTCYKDNSRVIYSDPAQAPAGNYRSLYYCLVSRATDKSQYRGKHANR